MAEDSKIINIYADKNGALYGAPFGPSKKYGMRALDKLFLLMPGYNDELLTNFVNRLFDQCGSEDAKDDLPPGIQTYLKARSYKEATENLGLLVGFYAEGEGFAFTPTKKNAEGGFVLDDAHTVDLRPNCTAKEMANAVKKALAAVRAGQTE